MESKNNFCSQESILELKYMQMRMIQERVDDDWWRENKG